MKICIGIPSYLPDDEQTRIIRSNRINQLFIQLEELWPELDILVTTNNWKDFKPVKTKNKQILVAHEGLNLIEARKALREDFLQLGYDYIIMLDDDAIIESINDANINYIKELEKHPQGFCFYPGKFSKYHPYITAALNLCAISRYIYEKEPMLDINPQNNEGYEDRLFACLLHHKYGAFEFEFPKNIKCTHINLINTPSTWTKQDGQHRPFYRMWQNTDILEKYIYEHKDFPKNYKDLIVIEKSIYNDNKLTPYLGKNNYSGF